MDLCWNSNEKLFDSNVAGRVCFILSGAKKVNCNTEPLDFSDGIRAVDSVCFPAHFEGYITHYEVFNIVGDQINYKQYLNANEASSMAIYMYYGLHDNFGNGD